METPVYTYDYYLNAFKEAKETANQLITGVDERVFKTPPAEGKWCIGEIMSHLIQIGHQYLDVIEQGLDKPDDKLPKGKAPFRHGFIAQWFIKTVGPTNQKPMPTAKQFKPKELDHISKEGILADFHELQDTFISILEETNGKGINLRKVKVKNPVVKWISMNVSVCFAVLEAHQRRHFNQIRNLKKQLS